MADAQRQAVEVEVALMEGDYLADGAYSNWPAPDGRRFLLLQSVDQQTETVMIYNWGDELRKSWR